MCFLKYCDECGPLEVKTNCSNQCGLTCSTVCPDLNTCFISPSCIPGCKCIDGLVKDENGKCVDKSNCKCTANGVTYAVGEMITDKVNCKAL